jgi:hypothetical protein
VPFGVPPADQPSRQEMKVKALADQPSRLGMKVKAPAGTGTPYVRA